MIPRFFTLGTRRGSKEGNQALNLKERRFLTIVHSLVCPCRRRRRCVRGDRRRRRTSLMMIVMMHGVHECVDATIYYRFRLGPGCGCTLALPSMVQQGSSRSRPAVMSIAIAIIYCPWSITYYYYVGPWPRHGPR